MNTSGAAMTDRNRRKQLAAAAAMEPVDWQRQNGDLAEEPRALFHEVTGRVTGTREGLVNRAPAPLDRYKSRAQLDSNETTNMVRWLAGDRLRTDWYLSGLEPRMVANLQGSGGGTGDPRSFVPASERAAEARDRFRDAIRAVGIRLCPVLIEVVCCERSAHDWAHSAGHRGKVQCQYIGMTTLRIALDTLADHYGLTQG